MPSLLDTARRLRLLVLGLLVLARAAGALPVAALALAVLWLPACADGPRGPRGAGVPGKAAPGEAVSGGTASGEKATARDAPTAALLDSAAAWKAYRAAVRDARVAEPGERFGGLTPLRAGVPSLSWDGTPGRSRVLVATWTDSAWAAPQAALARGDTARLALETWVTPVPAVRAFCRALDRRGAALHQRLAQRLGLPPGVAYDRVAVFWVAPGALFRPCPDLEVTDAACELNAPAAPPAHRRWMERQRAAAYDGDPPYPWTRLGYTYDWGAAAGSRPGPGPPEVGLSEYVAPAGTPVVVRRVASTEAYCS